MPECVEVEITRRKLEPLIVGRRLCRVRLLDALLERPADFGRYSGVLRAIDRRGKALRFVLAEDRSFTLWLGMTGSLQVNADAARPPRLVLEFDGASCSLIDPRRFGRVSWQGRLPAGWDVLSAISRLQPPREFEESFCASKARIKALLMDQDKIAGLGNIYANEVLFDAGIRPWRRACSLSREETGRLWASLRRILGRALRDGGISMRDFYHPDGRKGAFQNRFTIYGLKKGSPCPRCGAPVKVVLTAQRSTFFCRNCQK
ncbi:MAG: DNA-formamidopyrimidine glycosylase [Elusimicrobia bacterium]|nr:DNA-formamidopyrimidine glycosylase [Elusimicrobiota bacterium]